ncbi:MAG: CDP-diacylglycerol--glycerol-3-phosphate 3-phosphatidyltransferase [Thermoleophilia bacterium]|nr:CDP-diacylglycerol--glycerol-3-phosphate 3-phosphatidyltransferase [Thermoleophilia bacterium]
MRTAISPRFATSTFPNGGVVVEVGIGRVFSRKVTIADQLTLVRLLAVPVVVGLFAWDFAGHAWWATGVFTVAMATDQVDGWLARRRGETTAFGALLDPVADKVLALVGFVMLVGAGVVPAWMVAAIIAREIAISGLRLAAIERRIVLGARDLGKLKAWSQSVAVSVGGLAVAGAWSNEIAWWAALVAVALTWVSGLDYARVAPRVLRGERA